MAAKVLLSFHVRVLLPSLRCGGRSVSHAFQVALPGVARICDFVLRAGLDIEHLYGRIRKPTAGYSSWGEIQSNDLDVQSKSEQLKSGWYGLTLPVVDGAGFRMSVWGQSRPFHGLEPG